jgi:hypothetical protein
MVKKACVPAPLQNADSIIVEFGALHTARGILDELERRGLKISLDGKDHIVIEPAFPLTFSDLLRLTQNKEAILKYLRLRRRM